jgi:hypothetical protein
VLARRRLTSPRAGARLLLGLVVLVALPSPALAQTSRLVRIEDADIVARVEELQAAGFDVVEGSVDARSAELVVSAAELGELGARGLAPEILAEGRPLGRAPGSIHARSLLPDTYPDVASIVEQMRATAEARPDICELVDLTTRYGPGPTFEGRHLYALKISDNAAEDEDEPAFLAVAGHHAREAGNPTILLQAASLLVSEYGADDSVTDFVDDYEIWVAPLWNPDGYDHVYNVNNLWRKNRRDFGDSIGVDLNRNYAVGWRAICSGSTDPLSGTYKGPTPGSEVETQTMMALSRARRFAKVIDLHSYGREVLWGYRCLSHPFLGFWQSEAVAMSEAAGYAGENRPPSAEGEHQQWQAGRLGAHAFLVETLPENQPAYAEVLSETGMVWPAMLWLLDRPVSVSGHVTDACTASPLQAGIRYLEVALEHGETNESGGAFGRYHATLPPDEYTLEFSAAGYQTQLHGVTVTLRSAEVIEVELLPASGSCTSTDGGAVDPDAASTAGSSPGDPRPDPVDGGGGASGVAGAIEPAGSDVSREPQTDLDASVPRRATASAELVARGGGCGCGLSQARGLRSLPLLLLGLLVAVRRRVRSACTRGGPATLRRPARRRSPEPATAVRSVLGRHHDTRCGHYP